MITVIYNVNLVVANWIVAVLIVRRVSDIWHSRRGHDADALPNSWLWDLADTGRAVRPVLLHRPTR